MSIFKSLDNLSSQENTDDTVTPIKFSTIENNLDSFLDTLEKGTISNAKIQMTILANFQTYINFDNFENVTTRKTIQRLWTNKRFLQNFLSVLSGAKELSSLPIIDITSINKICYDYYIRHITENDTISDEILDLILNIAKTVDKQYIRILNIIMDDKSALFMAMARFSSFNDKERIFRLNNFIIRLGYPFTIKDIIYIYAQFYSDNFSTLFTYTMINHNDYNSLTDQQKEMYNSISAALLNILESMPTNEIYNVVKTYINYIELKSSTKDLRFDIFNISGFPRSKAVIDSIYKIQ